MDKVVLVDENDKVIGEISISKAHKKGLLHRVSVIYVYNSKGEVLIQHRADDGRLDHSSAGHVDPGESYLDAAKRELFEELGIKNIALEKFGKALNSENRSDGNNVNHFYTLYKVKTKPIKINKEEIQKVYWAKPADILKDMEKDPKNLKYTNGFKVSIKEYLKNI